MSTTFLRRRRAVAAFVSITALALGLAACGSSNGDDGDKAPTDPNGAALKPFKGPTSDLKPFDTNVKAGKKPDVPKRMAFANQTDAQFFLDLQNGLNKAADERGLDFLSANAQDDSAKNISQLNTFLQRGVGALVTVPVGGEQAQRAVKQDGMSKNAAVMSFLAGPSTSVFAADQYKIGNLQGVDAAEFIKADMGGDAKVVYFNADKLSDVLIPRHTGAIEGVKTAGAGVEIVADEYNAPGVESGAALMATILQAHPDVNVILGDDDSVVGALQAAKAAGKLDQIKYASGVNGSASALDLAASGKSPFKVSYAFSYGVLGYVTGQFGADWIDGKSIPQVIIVKSVGLRTKEDIDQFNEATKNPEDADASKYVELFGNISYDTRAAYVDYAP